MPQPTGRLRSRLRPHSLNLSRDPHLNLSKAGGTFSAPRLTVLMIISTVMSPRKKDVDEEPIEPEILDPAEHEIAEISPPPEVSPLTTLDNLRAADTTAQRLPRASSRPCET